ncbi:MAG: carbon-nitrogen hydrolase family protein [Lentisphaeraceae bacterium]|nr:carbon-nitrogen hydrolase family protein [Lentisphaeraceae bacterium]
MKVALIQTSSVPDLETNYKFAKEQLEKAKIEGADMAIFPECAMCWAKADVTRSKAKTLQDWQKTLSALITDYSLCTVWGGLQILEDGKIYNTTLVFSDKGELMAKYEKTHLFQLFIKDKISVDETEVYEFGRTGPVTFELNGFTFGLSICYDIRFPEFYLKYEGVDALICTAAFTKKTGRAHWETLLRARAIENQSYMLAAAQCGINELSGIHTWGHSMAIDSWGKVLVDAGKEPGLIICEMTKEKINTDREILPALKNKRL